MPFSLLPPMIAIRGMSSLRTGTSGSNDSFRDYRAHTPFLKGNRQESYRTAEEGRCCPEVLK